MLGKEDAVDGSTPADQGYKNANSPCKRKKIIIHNYDLSLDLEGNAQTHLLT
jgi:hypothetical protein